MKSKTILVCVVVAVLGIGAMIAGFVAEATKLKGSQLGLVPECKYPSDPAMGLVIAAIVALVLARGIITSATGCCCSFFDVLPNLFVRYLIVISWFTYILANILFLMGVKYYTGTGVERLVNGKYRCYALWNGIFTGAGIVGFVSVLFGLAYYLSYVSAQNNAAKAETIDLELETPPPMMSRNYGCLHEYIETPMPVPRCLALIVLGFSNKFSLPIAEFKSIVNVFD